MLINRRNALMAGKRLPYDAEVEWLKTTGVQLLDTGVRANLIYGLLFNFMSYEISSDGWASIISSASDTFTVGFNNVDYGRVKNRVYIRYGSGSLLQRGLLIPENEWISLKVFNGVLSVADYVGRGLSSPITSNAGKLTIAANSAFQRKSCVVFGTLKLYNSANSLIRDFQPVRFTNELGVSEGAMYDRANPTVGMNPDGSPRTDGLYRNRGTGAFVIGADVAFGASAANGGGYKLRCTRRSYRRSSRPSARFWQPRLWKEVA